MHKIHFPTMCAASLKHAWNAPHPHWPMNTSCRTRTTRNAAGARQSHIRARTEGRFIHGPQISPRGCKVYWSMATTPEGATLINRCEETQTYEARGAAGTLPKR